MKITLSKMICVLSLAAGYGHAAIDEDGTSHGRHAWYGKIEKVGARHGIYLAAHNGSA